MIRFDPIWRRIKADAYTQKLEGKFGDRLLRLEGLSNWGVLTWLYPYATATKLAHHYGVEHNATAFLAPDPERHKYAASFRPAAHVLHWGHLPLSFAGEEGVLRAAHIDPVVTQILHEIIDDVVAAGSLTCDHDGHDCVQVMKSLDAPFGLYRWLSAWLVGHEWRRLWRAIQSAAEETPDERETRERLIRALVCRQDRGYRVLTRCNEADYVPRDLQQAGTAWLSVDLESLWEPNPLGSDAAKEWSLIDAARAYLDDRFFHARESLLLHSLVSRAIAGGLIASGLDKTELIALTSATDDYYASRLPTHHRHRVRGLQTMATSGKLTDRWVSIGSFDDVSLPRGNRFEMEDVLTTRSGASRTTYPFSTGVSVLVEPDRSRYPEAFAGAGRRYATVHVHHRLLDSGEVASVRWALDVVARIASCSAPGLRVGNELMGWLLQGVVEQRVAALYRSAGLIVEEQKTEVKAGIARFLALRSSERLLAHGLTNTLVKSFVEGAIDIDAESQAAILLGLPWPVLKTAGGRAVMSSLLAGALGRLDATKDNSNRGHALELAVAADQWLNASPAAQRFVFTGSTLLGKDGLAEHEWDVVRVDLEPGRGWNVTAIECALRRSTAKDAEGRAKLEFLRERLQRRFADMSRLDTRFANTSSGGIAYEDAGRGFLRL